MHCQSLSFERQFPCWENYGAPSRHPFRFSSHFRFSSPTFRICVKRQQRHPEFLQFQACGLHASFNSPLNCAASEVTLGRPQVSLNPLDRSLDNLLERPVKGEIFELKATLKGARIFLIGMMGCGKSTVGKLLAEALDYRFLDSDTMIEEASGGMTVAQIFKEHNEDTFRDFETQALMGLSNKDHLVVGTGGGIVIRPINWTYLRHGLTVYLDVPLEALAERVVAVGTASRPLLGVMVDDSAHSKALARLSSIFQSRAPLYYKADITVSLYRLALSLGCEGVQDLTPKMIADQVIEELYRYVVKKIQNSKAAPAA